MANEPRSRAAFASLPFDRLDSPYSIVYKDDFVQALANADLDGAVTVTSDLIWIGDEGGGDSAPHVDIVASVANHPGIISLETGATTAADGDIGGLTLPNAILPDVNGVYMSSTIRIPDISDTKVSFGMVATRTEAVNSSAANVIALVFDPEDAANVGDVMFFLQLNVGGVDLEAVFDTATITENEWVKLELVADSTGVTGRVTTDNGSQQKTLAGAPATALLVGWLVEAVGAAEEVVEIDNFCLRYLRRTEADTWGN
jgi:hypothetical protein